MGTIVVGYVPKPEGAAALARAIEEARLRGARLLVVSSDRGGLDAEANAIGEQLAASGVEHEVRRIAAGSDAARDLEDVAGEVDAELLVIGLRRRSPVGKLILGSSAQRILLDAPCPVLAVKAG